MESKMPQIEVLSDTKNKEFYFIDGTYFVLLGKKLNDRNFFCVFDDKLCDMARKFADKHIPKITLDTEKYECLSKSRTEYWTKLFNIAIWIELEKQNKITPLFSIK